MNRVEAQVSEVAADIGEVVSSLQFHDITRQQIEHVEQVIADWQTRLSSAPGTNGNGVGPSVLGDVCDIEVRQLSNSKDELESAVKDTVRHLDGISQRTNAVSTEIAGLMHLEGSGGDTFLSELKESISRVLQSLNEDAEATQSLSMGIGSVASTLKTLAAFVDEIEDIGTEIELIALNARIKAAHTGIAGAALGVLAEEIKNLSAHGREETILITSSLHGIGSLAADLDTATSEMKDTTIKETGEMAKEMNGLLESFRVANVQIAAVIARIEAGSRRARPVHQEGNRKHYGGRKGGADPE